LARGVLVGASNQTSADEKRHGGRKSHIHDAAFRSRKSYWLQSQRRAAFGSWQCSIAAVNDDAEALVARDRHAAAVPQTP
jgi:hypothetical protein